MRKKWLPKERIIASWEHEGLECAVCIGAMSLCGYVRVPPKHPLYGRSYEDVEARVHGGLTFDTTDEDGTWFGFDCAHVGDVTGGFFDVFEMKPKYIPAFRAGRRWPIEDVVAETCLLASQLARRTK